VSERVTLGPGPGNPLLHQVNTRVLLHRLGADLGRPATLDDVPDAELDRLATQGYDWVYLLGVWRTGAASRQVSRDHPAWRAAFEATLDDLTDDDICGSCFAVTGYEVHPDLGGDDALGRIRTRLADRGLRLMLDFVPNHLGLDHPWVEQHPEYFVAGTDGDLQHRPQDVVRLGDRVFACGRDPYLDGWPDTLQLDYSRSEVQGAMTDALVAVADRCDGIRCDMAMLLLPDVFEETWGRRPDPFWPTAVARLREHHPGVVLLAEVYWDLEWELQQQGFDYTYDKRLHDRLRDLHAGPVREHLSAEVGYQHHLARFLENHDEPRAAATFAREVHRPASLATYLIPGLRFLHQGQREGFRTHISPHLCRGPVEAIDEELAGWYDQLLELLRDPIVRDGVWSLTDCTPVTEHEPADAFVAWTWRLEDAWWLVVLNFGRDPGRCHVRLPFDDVPGAKLDLVDRLSGDRFERHGDELADVGLYVELPPWGAHVLAAGFASG
jgi:glycosidase